MVKTALPLFLLIFITACSLLEVRDSNLVRSSYRAADALLDKAKEVHLYPGKPILVASFVDIDNVQVSSTFGRIIAEQMGSRIAQRGHKIIEVKLRTNSLFVRGSENENEGEFMLSRELQDISLQYDAHAVVVGTYAKAAEVVYVTAKVIRTKDNIILGSYDYVLPIGKDTKKMLQAAPRR